MIYRAISSGMHFFDNSFIFPNYNDPKYTTSVVKTYLDKKENNGTPSVTDWDQHFPLLWKYMKK